MDFYTKPMTINNDIINQIYIIIDKIIPLAEFNIGG